MGGDSNRLGVFHASCWVLGLIGFVELAAVGMALGLQKQVGQRVVTVRSEPQVVEKVVTQYLTIPGEEREVIVEKPAEEESEIAELPMGPPQFRHEPVHISLTAPPIADPVVERLVEESRTLRIEGDLMRSMLKLEEASKTAPEDPNVLYQFAEVYEASGLYDKAGDYYQKVFGLGTVGAGSLWELAAAKLRDGIAQPEEMAGKFALGRVRVFRDNEWEGGERVILTVPVSAAPNLGIDLAELERALRPEVHLYDQVNGKVVHRDAISSTVETSWVTPPVDWQDGGAELMRVIYEIPSQGAGEENLFGDRKYHGQVVELFYQGELIDRLASPRHLASGQDTRAEDAYEYPDNYIPDDFNYENPLLPPLP